MPKQRTAPRSLSLERKLPILIGGLVTCAVLATLLLVHWELRSSEIAAAAERLRIVGDELGAGFSTVIAQRATTYEAVARDPAIVAHLMADRGSTRGDAGPADRGSTPGDVGSADRGSTPGDVGSAAHTTPWGTGAAHGIDEADTRAAAVRRLLDSLRQPSDGSLPIQLRNTDGRVVAATGSSPAFDERGGAPAPPSDNHIVYSEFVATPDGPTYWVSVPVWRGGSVIGHITQQRGVGSGAAAASRLEGLLGGNMELYVAHLNGGNWAGLDGSLLSGVPRVGEADLPFTYARADGTTYFAYTRALGATPWLLVAQMPMAGVTARTGHVLRRIALTGVFLLALGLLAAWLVSRSVTRPLRQLGGVADAIAAGDYSRRAQLERADEIGRLARSFDAMASRVDGTHAELQRRFREAQSLAAELELANARLQAAIRDAESARADAQEASSAKSEFLATMSHEIRTPINAIVGYTDLLDLRLAGSLTEQQENYIERIRLSSEHLTSIVNDVLDFAKIESGQMRIAREVRSARASIDGAVSMLQGRANEKGIRVTASGPVEAVFLGDAQRVQQILLNLISNALKFTPAGGRVNIECARRESRGFGQGAAADVTAWTCIAVQDNGIGISPDQIGPIFEPFVQGAGGYTRPHGGTGLGLAISRSLARMMDGDITVESEVNTGSTFTLWLPHPSTAPAVAR